VSSIASPEEALDTPRRLAAKGSLTDRIFHGGARTVGLLILVVFGAIGFFLALQAVPTIRHYGWHFFLENQWQPQLDIVGISSVMIGTVVVAIVALVFSFPLALTSAIYISEYAPARLKQLLVSTVDLMASVPSIVYGMWGLLLLQPRLPPVSHWLHQNLGFIPLFQVDTDPNAPVWAQSKYVQSMFIAGMVVSMMVIPIACSVMREVFGQAPVGEREAALALGATKWGMIRAVVLPFGRGGIIGGTMLALGRALGETVAVMLILSQAFDIKFRIFEIGGITTSALIASKFSEATTTQLSALLTAGFVLFVMTIVVNTIAAMIVSRSRSGAATEI